MSIGKNQNFDDSNEKIYLQKSPSSILFPLSFIRVKISKYVFFQI